MAKYGNLYWEIQFTALYNGVADCRGDEQTHVAVQSHDFADAYEKAAAMYDAVLKTQPDRVYCAQVFLRDDGSVQPSAQYGIYVSRYILDEKISAFFSAGADKCLRLTFV